MERVDRDPVGMLSEALRCRDLAADGLDGITYEVALACAAMSGRLADGAVLRTVGRGVSAVDADHVTVEFIHPVIVGKRSIPALAIDADAPGRIRPESVVLALALDDDPGIARLLADAGRAGCLTIALTTDETIASAADHPLVLVADDRLVARELQVTTYHLLWELVHEHLDAGASTAAAAPDDLRDLYPFLYSREAGGDAAVVDHLVASTTPKLTEIRALRRAVLTDNAADVALAAAAIRRCRDGGGTVWTFGNGGSCTDARAVATLLSGVAGRHELAVEAHALADDVATLTALSNDVHFDVVFARMLRSLASVGDVAIGLSTSGGSANVLAGLETARDLGLTTIGFAGYDGGQMADLDGLDHLFVVPSSSVHRIQEAQTTLAHVLIGLGRSPDGT